MMTWQRVTVVCREGVWDIGIGEKKPWEDWIVEGDESKWKTSIRSNFEYMVKQDTRLPPGFFAPPNIVKDAF